VVSGQSSEADASLDTSLRPRRFDHFVGQDKVKSNLDIAIAAAQKRKEPLDHLLFYGPPGLGKTTLSHIVAAEMGANLKVTSGPAIERPGDLAAILTNIQENDFIFIDEIHRLNRTVEEILYPALEDFVMDIFMGKGPGATSVRLNLPRFTLVGATTRYALLSPPLRDRFGAVYHLDFYDENSIRAILRRSARILKVQFDEAAVLQVARRARGTPRVANRILRRIRDYAEVKANGKISEKVAIAALEALEVDDIGLDEVDYKVLETIIKKFDGGPVGLDTIAASIGEESDTIMDVYEPYLLQLGFIDRTPRGRAATRLAYEHMNIPYNRRNRELPPQGTLL
jgi:Holliday junction DNA helicase RuvB